jgi:hypothetical protein
MSGLIIYLILWCGFSALLALAFSRLGKMIAHEQDGRYLNCFLWCVLGGVVGWIWLAARPNLARTRKLNEAQLGRPPDHR